MPAIGTAPCLACSRDVVVRENDRGALNFSCAHCDLSCYAKEGTEAKRKLMPRVKVYPEREAEKKPAGDAKPAPSAPPAKPPADKPRERMPWE